MSEQPAFEKMREREEQWLRRQLSETSKAQERAVVALDEMKARAERAEAACAMMRNVFQGMHNALENTGRDILLNDYAELIETCTTEQVSQVRS